MNTGYPLEWFAERVDDYLKCGICSKVLLSPCATSCGHVYCRDCLRSWIEYYGICPERCGEVELQQLSRPLHIEKRISGLLVRCKYVRLGCDVKVALADKTKHETFCSFRGKDGHEARRRHSAENTNLESKLAFRRSNTGGSAPPAPAVNTMQAQHTYRLKRTRPKEPLGLVVLSGAKTSDGRPKDFFVKKVNPGTPACKAGLRPGDRIIQIDNHDLWKISIKEAVSRIKDQPSLALTIVRWENLDYNLEGGGDDHIYDEILYADLSQPLLSQQDENSPPFQSMSYNSPSGSRRLRPPMTEELRNHPKMEGAASPSAAYIYGRSQKVPIGEKGSKDSGLSSGSSGSPRPIHRNLERVMQNAGSASNLDRCVGDRQTYRTRREMLCPLVNQQESVCGAGGVAPEQIRGRIEGDYEVEEIYLEKNGTSQLGVTLGYDTKSPKGQLYVCELTPDGLAAKDGRIQTGDIIRRVNGFEVYDPEEAILLFLEQDQDITLTVARKLKKKQVTGQSHSGRPRSFEALDSTTAGMDGDLRRIESCGSLDSHTFRHENEASVREHQPSPLCQQRATKPSRDNMDVDSEEYEQMGSPVQSRRGLSPGRSHRTALLSQRQEAAVALDYTFKPISALNQRPKTTGPFPQHRFSPQVPRSSTNPWQLPRPSSATPEGRRRIHHHPIRHASFGCMDNQGQQHFPRLPQASQSDSVYTRNESLV